jgi:hypothetical protein
MKRHDSKELNPTQQRNSGGGKLVDNPVNGTGMVVERFGDSSTRWKPTVDDPELISGRSTGYQRVFPRPLSIVWTGIRGSKSRF